MPDPNNPNDNQNQNPVQDIPAVPPTPPTDTPTPQVFPEDISIPPIPSGLTQTISDAPPQEEGTPPNLPPIISSGKPKKKFGGKMIATILGLLVLVGSLGAGIILVKQQQDIREKAACAPKCVGNIPYTCDSSGIQIEGIACPNEQTCSNGTCTPPCIPDGQCMTSSTACCGESHADTTCGYSIPVRCGPGGGGGVSLPPLPPATAPPPGSAPAPAPGSAPVPPPPSTANCILGVPNDSSVPNAPTLTSPANGATIYGNSVTLTWSAGSSNCPGVDVYDVVKIWFPDGTKAMEAAAKRSYIWRGNPPPAPFGLYRWNVTTYNVYGQTAPSASWNFTLAPGETAQCLAVKAYDTNWNLLTSTQLSTLKAGDKVRFTVAGTPADKIDKAKFTINGVERAETAIKKTGTDEFYDEYTIPTGTTSFTVNAKLHSISLGIWF